MNFLNPVNDLCLQRLIIFIDMNDGCHTWRECLTSGLRCNFDTMIRLVLTLAFAVSALDGFTQCSCGCAAGGSLFGDYSGNAVNEKHKLTAETSIEYKAFRPHVHTDGHVQTHTAGTAVSTEAQGLEMKGMSTLTLGLRYGLSKRATVMASVPFAYLLSNPTSLSGIGDASLAGVYQLLKKENAGLSGYVGIELPTGQQIHETLASDVVIGSGSFDPFGGLVAVYAKKNVVVRINGLYKHNMSNEGTRYGSNLTGSFSIGYGNATSNAGCTPSVEKKTTWAVNGIALVEHSGVAYINNVLDQNSGGTAAFTGGGASLTLGRWMIPVSILIPVYQHVRGEQHKTAYKTRIGAAVTF